MSLSRYTGWILAVAVSLLVSSSATAQPVTFIHIQSENNKAFNVSWKGTVYPSSATGYLVIPQVTAGEQLLIFSFQDTSLPAYRFSLTMDDKPRGFTLRQSITNTWSLFDMVSFAITKGTENPKQKEEKPILAISQPAEPEKNPVPKADTTKPIVVPALTAVSEKPAKKTPVSTEPPIQKIFDKANAAGIDQVYIVINKGKADTIAVFIPALKEDAPKQGAFQIKGDKRSEAITDQVYQPLYSDRFKLSIK